MGVWGINYPTWTQKKKKKKKFQNISLTVAMATDITSLFAFFIVPNFIKMNRHHGTPTPERKRYYNEGPELPS